MNYTQILGLIHQLPEEEIEKLFVALQSEISSKKKSDSLHDLILNAPTWSETEFNKYQKARNHINSLRLG